MESISTVIKSEDLYRGFFEYHLFSEEATKRYIKLLGYLDNLSNNIKYYYNFISFNIYLSLEKNLVDFQFNIETETHNILKEIFKIKNINSNLLYSNYIITYFNLINKIQNFSKNIFLKIVFDLGKLFGLYGLQEVAHVPYNFYKISYSFKEEELLSLLTSITYEYSALFKNKITERSKPEQIYSSYELLLHYLLPVYLVLFKQYETVLLTYDNTHKTHSFM
jgi:hypothetical protein